MNAKILFGLLAIALLIVGCGSDDKTVAQQNDEPMAPAAPAVEETTVESTVTSGTAEVFAPIDDVDVGEMY